MDVGRPRHSEWEKLGFEAKTVLNDQSKKLNVAYCLQCKKSLKNTAASRLRSHRNVCKLSLNQLKGGVNESKENSNNDGPISNEEIDNYSVSDDEVIKNCQGIKRKASSSLSRNIDESTISISSISNNTTAEDPYIATKKTETIKNSITTVRKADKLKNFVDQVNDFERAKIDQALVEFFIVFNIEFEYIKSIYTKNLIQLLRPAYALQLPETEKMSGEILSQVYAKHINNTNVCSSGILLINKDKPQVSLTFTNNGKYMFVKIQDLSNEDSELFIENSIKIAQEKYCTNIYAVVSNIESLSKSLTTNGNCNYSTCISVQLQQLVKTVVDIELLNQVDSLLTTFSVPALQEEFYIQNGISIVKLKINDSTTYYNGFYSCSKNLKTMRKMMGNDTYTFDQNSLFLLFNSEFEKKLNEALLILKFVHETINKQGLDYTLAAVIEDWYTLLNSLLNENLKQEIKIHIEQISQPVALAANYLHPRYRGKNFKKNEIFSNKMLQFVFERLAEDGMESFFHYQEKTNIFQTLISKNYESPEIFWRVAAQHHKELSNFALQILKIPAFASNKKLSSMTQCLPENSKIADLYSLLKINE